MEIQEPELIHVLTFNTPGHENSTITVTSPHIAMIQKFVNTHLTHDAMDYVKTYDIEHVPDKISDRMDETDLKYWILSDNETNNNYSIPSSQQLIEIIATIICSVLSDISLFGDIISLTEFPIFRALNDLIDDLEFGTVLDNQLRNGADDNTDKLYYQIHKHFNFGDAPYDPSDEADGDDIWRDDPPAPDDAEIYDHMQSELKKITDKEPLPFTIKGYVSAFTSLLFKPSEV